MLGEARLSRTDLKAIDHLFASIDAGASPDRLMETASHVLSALSQNVGIVVSPSLADNRLNHIEFVLLPDKRILVVLVSTANIIHNKGDSRRDDLARTTWIARSLFKYRVQRQEPPRDPYRDRRADGRRRFTIDCCKTRFCCASGVSKVKTGAGVYVDGTSNILTKPEFVDMERMRELFRTFEESRA